MLVRLHEAAKEDESISIYDNIDFFSDIYANHWPHRHDFPDPSHMVPVNLSKNRRHYVVKGYQEGIDTSIYANNKMLAIDVKEMLEALILLKNLGQWNKHTSKTMKVEFIDK